MTKVTITIVPNRRKVECLICKNLILKDRHRLRIDVEAYSGGAVRHICETCLTHFSNSIYLKNK